MPVTYHFEHFVSLKTTNTWCSTALELQVCAVLGLLRVISISGRIVGVGQKRVQSSDHIGDVSILGPDCQGRGGFGASFHYTWRIFLGVGRIVLGAVIFAFMLQISHVFIWTNHVLPWRSASPRPEDWSYPAATLKWVPNINYVTLPAAWVSYFCWNFSLSSRSVMKYF